MADTLIPCIICPTGCEITVTADGRTITAVTGYACRRGETYARREFLQPERIFTGMIRVQGGDAPVVSVRSAQPIPRDLQLAAARALKERMIDAPVYMHDVVWDDILGTGIQMLATAEVSCI